MKAHEEHSGLVRKVPEDCRVTCGANSLQQFRHSQLINFIAFADSCDTSILSSSFTCEQCGWEVCCECRKTGQGAKCMEDCDVRIAVAIVSLGGTLIASSIAMSPFHGMRLDAYKPFLPT